MFVNKAARSISSGLIVGLFLSACNQLLQSDNPPFQNYNFEIIPDGESEQIQDISKKTRLLQNKRAIVFNDIQKGQKLRGVHPKTHGCVVTDFQIIQDIDPALRVGLFSTPGRKYQALIRYSNASVQLAHDLENNKNSSRGMAIKILDVGEPVLADDKENKNQDFLMINTPEFAFPNVRSYQRLTNALIESPSGSDPRAAFSPAADWTAEDIENLKKTGRVIAKIGTKIVRNPLEVQYFAAAPSLFGSDRVMKFSAEPCDGVKPQQPFDAPPTKNYLHEALASTMGEKDDVCLDFKIQVLNADQIDEDRKQGAEINGGDIIEDVTRVWDQDQFPFTSVAKITIRTPQGIDLSSKLQQNCEHQSFNPWHALTEHRPLGGINRLRRPVYTQSAINRSN